MHNHQANQENTVFTMTQTPHQVDRISPDSPSGFHYFFGYYDKNPWDRNESRLLAHRTTFLDQFPRANGKADIGFIALQDNRKFVKVGETTAWNWQQGAQLQWFRDGDSGEEMIIFNNRLNDKLVTVILSPDSGNQRVVDSPVYTIAPSGRYALSLNYARLF